MPLFLCPFCGAKCSHWETYRGSGNDRQVKVQCWKCKKISYQKFSNHI